MWQTPSQKSGAKSKRGGGRWRRPIHIRRVNAEISSSTPGKPVEGRVVVNDLSQTGIGLFCAQPVTVGAEVTLTLAENKPITIRGKVVYCQPADTHLHVLSPQAFNYRVGIQFTFASDAEKNTYLTYLEASMNELVPGSVPSAPAAAA